MLAAAVLLAGCASTPKQAPPALGTAAAEIRRDLGTPDDSFLQAKSLDPEHLATEVIRRNPTLDKLRNLWRAAGERPAQAVAWEDPRFSYDFAPATIGVSDLDFGQNIVLSQPIPWPDKLRARGEAARAEAAVALDNLEDARRLLANTARAAFYDWVFLHRAIDINATNQRLLADTQKLAEEKYIAGKAAKQDAVQAEIEFHHLEHRSIVLERQRRVAAARINTLLHRPTEASLPPPPAAFDPVAAVPELKSLQARAVEARPELHALAHRIEARRAGVDVARMDFRPDVSVMAAYNSMWMREEHRPTVGLSFNIPLGEDRSAALRERKAELNASQSAFAAAVDKVALEVFEARETTVESLHVVHLYKDKFLPAAEAHVDAARADYAAGKLDILNLLTAEKNLMLARLGYQQALADYHTRRANLEAAAGGGF